MERNIAPVITVTSPHIVFNVEKCHVRNIPKIITTSCSISSDTDPLHRDFVIENNFQAESYMRKMN